MSGEQENQTQAAAAPTAEDQTSNTPATTTAAKPENAITKFSARLPDIIRTANYGEMWGVELVADAPAEHVPTTVVLQKFMRANNGDLAAAEKQLTEALKWRKEMDVVNVIKQPFDEKKFGGLGYVTVHPNADGRDVVITWNIYGAVKDNKATFGDVDEFVRWRAALMEIGVQKLKLNEAKEPIPEGGKDPYQMVQVHDYLSVSFFRMDPNVKAASQKTISTFSMAYPELLSQKYFVNVPIIMGWMYAAMKLILSPATLKKFHPMSDGTGLVNELKGTEASLPKEYGGKGASVKEGITVGMIIKEDVIPAATGEAPVAAVNLPVVNDATPTENDKVKETQPVDAVKDEKPEENKEVKHTDEVEDAKKKMAGLTISNDGKATE